MADKKEQVTVKGHKNRKPRKKLKHIGIDFADNGGHIVTHRYEQKSESGAPSMMPMDQDVQHVFSNGAETVNHLKSHLMKGTTSKNQKHPHENEEIAEAAAKPQPQSEEEDEAEEEG